MIKKIIVSLLMLFTISSCASSINVNSKDYEIVNEFATSKVIDSYKLSKYRTYELWGINDNLISIEKIDRNNYQYKIYYELFLSDKGSINLTYTTKIEYNKSKKEITDFIIMRSVDYGE